MKARKILEITSYPPPRSGWGVRVSFLKRRLEAEGHVCTVLNTGRSRKVPSSEYVTVLGGLDFLRKVWRFSRSGHRAHLHVNGASPKGFLLTISAGLLNRLAGRSPVMTFHAGTDQTYFPRHKAPWLASLYRVLFWIPQVVICNSEEVRQKIAEYGVDPAKVVPIPAFSTQYLEFEPVPLGSVLEPFYPRYRQVLFCYLNIRPVFYPTVLIDAFAEVARTDPGVGLVLCGVSGHQESGLWDQVEERIARHDLRERIAIVDDLTHERFLTALSRASVYVRTHISDGVCSSVLESLALGTPVVAADNGTRPPGVVAYSADDASALAAALRTVLADREGVAGRIPRPELQDTLATEVRLLTA